MTTNRARPTGRRLAACLAALAIGLLCWPGIADGAGAPKWPQSPPPTGRAALAQPPPVTVLIVYYSLSGNTEKMARAVAEGVRQIPRATAVLKKAGEVSLDDLKGADGIALGSPTYWANMAAPMKSFIDDWWLKYRTTLADKVGGSFAAGGGDNGGRENVLYSLNLAMMSAGMIIVGPLEEGFGRAGVSALEPVNENALKQCHALGQRVATVAQAVKAAVPPKSGESR